MCSLAMLTIPSSVPMMREASMASLKAMKKMTTEKTSVAEVIMGQSVG